MPGLGTILNVILVIIGGILGHFFGKLLKERIQNSLTVACGVSVLAIGMGGALEGMLSLDSSGMIKSGRGVFIVVVMLLGAIVGEIINIEGWFERFGEWLKVKTGNSKDPRFVEGFITASFTVCIGAMAIVGSIEDGLYGNYSILLTKGILDCIIIMVMTASMGKGPVFSFIPIAILQGLVTLLSKVIEPLMTEAALANLSMIGNIMIFCVGINLVWGKKVRVANLLPALVFAVAFAFLPWQF
ncbi:MAG: DUF554 domain-containing protein [Lachnospiraceae bacterium]|nr:DUF554 domain-containing protein [Lachnospiraceae bacterium]